MPRHPKADPDFAQQCMIMAKIRKFYKDDQFTARQAADRYGVSPESVCELLGDARGLLRVSSQRGPVRPDDLVYFPATPAKNPPNRGPSEQELRKQALGRRKQSTCIRCRSRIAGDGKRNRSRFGHTQEECDLRMAEMLLRM